MGRTTPTLKFRSGPDGIHLFNRITGLNLLLDEIRAPATSWSVAPRQVSVALTNLCDLSCAYCYAPKHRARLDSARLCRWLDELDAEGCLGIGFGGGEPTLHPELPDLCRYAAENTGLAVTFTTHGQRLDMRLAADLKGQVHFVRISMDGVGDTYELLRGRPFRSLLSRFEIVRQLAPFGINFVVNDRTFPDLDAAITLASEVGAVEFLLIPEQPVRGRGGIDRHTAAALQRWVSVYRGPIPLSVTEAGADRMPTCNPMPGEKGLRAYAHIDASGVLKRSSYEDAGVPIGTDGVIAAIQVLESTDGDER
ncbi:MAG: radical SAM protein [Alphaproteobacteria bacterium]|nr:radical SAM protein [Alphaproteobacteria bacterium]